MALECSKSEADRGAKWVIAYFIVANGFMLLDHLFEDEEVKAGRNKLNDTKHEF